MSKRSAQKHRQERRELEGERRLAAMEVKALDAVGEIVERQTKVGESKQPRFTEPTSIFTSVYRWALSGMANEPGSRATMRQWDTWYRESVKREPFLSGLFNSVVQIDVNRGWTLTGGRNQVARYTKVLKDFDRYIKVGKQYVPGNTGGWRAYSAWQAQSYYATRMGFVSEIGRQGRGGPLFTMWSVDPCRCEMTGNPAMPLKYYPTTSGAQDWDYEAYIRKCSLISTDESALGYGFPAVARCYELAKIMVGVLSHYQQKLGTRTPDAILTGKYIRQDQWEEAIRARNENLLADPDAYLNSIATIMSSGGDMPEFILTTLSSLPDKWDIDLWTRILMRGYESAFGYKGEFTYENAGVIGRGNEVQTMHRNATAMGGKDFILAHQGELQNWLPPTLEFMYDERDVEGDKDEAVLQLAKAQVITEMSNWVEVSGGIQQSRIPTSQLLKLAAEQDVVPEDWAPGEEDVTATDEEEAEEQDTLPERIYRACQAFPDEPIVKYSWPADKTRILRTVRRRSFYFPKGKNRFNPYHKPAGSSEGGEFAEGEGGFGAGNGDDKKIKSKEFKTAGDARDFGRAHSTPPDDPDEYDEYAGAVQKYTDEGYKYINGELRDGKSLNELSPQARRIAKDMDKYMSPVDSDITVYRSVSKLPDVKPGDSVQDKGFISTTLFEPVLDNVTALKDKPRVRIFVGKGKKGFYPGAEGAYAEEEIEFVLPRGSKFRVVKIDRENGMMDLVMQ